MNADRSPFVSQSISFNHYTSFADASPTSYTQKIIYAWKKGLKTLSAFFNSFCYDYFSLIKIDCNKAIVIFMIF